MFPFEFITNTQVYKYPSKQHSKLYPIQHGTKLKRAYQRITIRALPQNVEIYLQHELKEPVGVRVVNRMSPELKGEGEGVYPMIGSFLLTNSEIKGLLF